MKTISTLTVIIFTIVLWSVIPQNGLYGQQTIYVDQANSTGANDGSSWENAYTSFDSAIYDENLEEGDTILVAKGTYTPSIQGNSFFISVGNLHIYGGFPSGGGTLQDRVWEADSTILRPKGHSVLYLDDTYKTTINGFYITGGNGMWGGGGIFNNAANNTFENLVVYENTAGMAGGMYNDHGGYNVTLNNVAFKNNQSIYENSWGSGGGLYNSADNLKITNCHFENNHCEGSNGANGGGINNLGDNLSIVNTDFIGNSAFCEDGFTVGGAINNSGNNFELKNCNFEQNSVNTINQNGKGGAIRHEEGNMVINNCTFSENEISSDLENVYGGALAIEGQNPSMIFILNSSFNENKATSQTNDADGGAIDINGLSSSKVSIINTVFTNNLATAELSRATGGAIVVEGVFLSLTNVDFIENSAVSNSDHAGGGAINNTGNAQLSINNALFEGNSASGKINPTVGGAMINSGGNITVNNTVFTNNSTLSTQDQSYGGALALFSGQNTINNALFEGNSASGKINPTMGGAMINSGGNITVNNTVFTNNSTLSTQGESYGGALTLFSGQNTITNSTFTSNTANGNVVLGGAIASISLVAENNIFWNNQLNGDLTNGDITSLGSLTINHSFTQSDFTSIGMGNILGTTSPFIDFDNPAGADGVWGTLDDGLAPACTSPIIDAGDNDALDPTVQQDIIGMNRYKNTIDMGAYEYHGEIQNIDSVLFCLSTPYSWNGETYTEPGAYSHATGTNNDGCEEIDVLVLETEQTIEYIATEDHPETCVNNSFTIIAYNTQEVTKISDTIGLPDGVTAEYNNNAIILTGTPTEAGEFHYFLGVEGCGSELIAGKITVIAEGEVTEPPTTNDLCFGNYISAPYLQVDNLNEITGYSDFPNGLTPIISNKYIWFEGTPTEAGTFNYTIELNGCSEFTYNGEITVLPEVEVEYVQQLIEICAGEEMEEMTHQITNTNTIGPVVGLPQGLSIELQNGDITISGTPTETGSFNYSFETEDGCKQVNGTVLVHGVPTIEELEEPVMACVNDDYINIELEGEFINNLGTIQGLPQGVNASYSSLQNTLKIVGTPTETGTFDFEIGINGSCGVTAALGTIEVLPESEIETPVEDTEVCIDHEMESVQLTFTNIDEIESTNGFPDGVSATIENDEIIIEGTPTEAGEFNYEIVGSSNCGTTATTGTIIVIPNYTIEEATITPEICENETLPIIMHFTDGVNDISEINGLPNGVNATLQNGVIFIQGTPTETGTFEYTIEVESDWCGEEIAAGTITVNELPTIDLGGDLAFCEAEEFQIELNAENENSTYEWSNGEETASITVNESGNYAVTVTNAFNCSSTDEMTITVNENPTVDVVMNDNNIITANAEYVIYQWIDCNTDEEIPGETGSQFIPDENGTYAVVVTSQNGCETLSDCVNISTIDTKEENWNALTAYPNPASQEVTIDFGKTIEKSKIVLMDLTGKVIQTETILDKQKHKIDIQNLAKGIYLVQIENNTIKIVKE